MSAKKNPLVFIPTYNERENIAHLFEEIRELKGATFDILFLDDNSPDGTGQVMDEISYKNSGVFVIHRSAKLGIGSAHKEGIMWAYERGYETCITMDADFTHDPKYILKFLDHVGQADIVLASRYLQQESLNGWNFFRKLLTCLGHWLTVAVLGLKYDATGAFRLYCLNRIPKKFIDLVNSNGYSFFFESLHLLNSSGFRIVEIPIALPPRTYGSSKMSTLEIFRSLKRLFILFYRDRFSAPYRREKKAMAKAVMHNG